MPRSCQAVPWPASDCTFPACWLDIWVSIRTADRGRRGRVTRDPKAPRVRVTADRSPWSADNVAWCSVYDHAQLSNLERLDYEWPWPLDLNDPLILLRAVKLATASKVPLPPTFLVRICAPPPIVVRDDLSTARKLRGARGFSIVHCARRHGTCSRSRPWSTRTSCVSWKPSGSRCRVTRN
ncbi:hypothetical protein AMAG_18486 [Allomyces macrogynus ATCC 38327]|uniref:Uncharacterized protein n=1 Tax=Allomyces macrogynus (strain ATCC 38327) TaxID=578462 RepID=A0A0L0SCQ7_ALLM3|nr:hypothetical protein AMAG_18486 [Allomyces macrogynus ATCC 38327]|eukprot:KNE60209.1 hypothetical protein AMAG_18486 [Allomyces macrogynus ATCC 38327]